MSLMKARRVEVWTWNPPGYGRSEGRAGLRTIADAALAFWEQVTKRRGGPDVTTWLCGNSLGCVVGSPRGGNGRTGCRLLRADPPQPATPDPGGEAGRQGLPARQSA